MADDDQQTIEQDFDTAVNMTRKELEAWLESDASQSVGQKDGGGESTGHESGRRIAAILEKKKADYPDEDYEHIRKVTGYVNRHLAQEPTKEDTETSSWRYSLMNWGHDPLK